ncbi:MAG: type VI secretion system ATPase TssH [Gammaproteobacteria bacterium]|nr:type VI secretion system ATPase TssH [Gammaproteobacteria bacterium]
MIGVDLKTLIERLDSFCKRTLEGAAGLCVGRGNYEITTEHFLLKALEDTQSDVHFILRHFGIEIERLQSRLMRVVESAKAGNTRKPVFATLLIELLEDAWLVSSLELKSAQIRSGAILLAMLSRKNRYILDDYYADLEPVSVETLKTQFHAIVAHSNEVTSTFSEGVPATATSAGSGDLTALKKYANNFTEQARLGRIDPVFGRDKEIRQMVDILARRRKNNPIVVGEPGVGKTAVVEGLALKIVQDDVPDVLKGVEIYGLDLGLLQAGASVKGEFEQRLNSVITEVKSSPKPLVLFIDEAHTLIGAGGNAGGSDAANLLKPALARGELRTIAATTWSEYKKYFEKDAALARRFQVVKVEEPSVDDAILIMRGLREKYEQAHGIYVRDEAVVASSQLSARYISGRQLPDKSVDLLDTACARVKISLSAKPDTLDDLERSVAAMERQRSAVERDIATGLKKKDEDFYTLTAMISTQKDKIAELTARWEAERALVAIITKHRGEIAKRKLASAEGDGETSQLEQELNEIERQLLKQSNGRPLIDYEVTADVVAKVVADWTGIPVGDMVKDEAETLLRMGDRLRTRIKGQDQAVGAIERGVQAAKAGLNNPNSPIGVFLFVGPSGVGKTECALGVADLLFGGERFVVTINMSEFQEKHTVSRLIGSPPGYVGYGEGGILTEAVRQRPYSVVLLDEVEKADLEVMNLFYQVFDKGTLSDSEGRVVDFRNTVIILTSNLATDEIMHYCADSKRIDTEALSQHIRPVLSRHFKPALLARMEIVPFYPIDSSVMGDIVKLKLDKVVKRLAGSQKIEMTYSGDVVDKIVMRCTEVETGARNIDHIVNKHLLPRLSTEILQQINAGTQASSLTLGVGSDGDFSYLFE